MRVPRENKAGPTAAAAKCHYCNRTVSDDSCRQERSGWYCLQRGLILGEGVRLFGPQPNPEPWKTDPEVIAAEAAVVAAETAWDAANDAWLTANRAMAEHRLLATRSDSNDVVLMLDSGLMFSRKHARKRQQLLDAEAQAREQRRAAETKVVKARVAHHEAVRVASTRDVTPAGSHGEAVPARRERSSRRSPRPDGGRQGRQGVDEGGQGQGQGPP